MTTIDDKIALLEKRLETLERMPIPVLRCRTIRKDFPQLLTSPLVCDVLEVPFHYIALEYSIGLIRANTLIVHVDELERHKALHNHNVSRLVARFYNLNESQVAEAGHIVDQILTNCPNVKDVELYGISNPHDMMGVFSKHSHLHFTYRGLANISWENACVVVRNLHLKQDIDI